MILHVMTRITAENGTYGGYQYSVEHNGVTEIVQGCPREHSSKTVHERIAYAAMRAELRDKRETDHDRAKEIMAEIEEEKELEVAEEVVEPSDKDLGDIVEPAPNMQSKKREIHAYMKARSIKYGANDNKKRLIRLIGEFHAKEERKE